jgi:hypothetical protein
MLLGRGHRAFFGGRTCGERPVVLRRDVRYGDDLGFGSVLYTANDTRAGYTIGGGGEIANLLPSLLPGWLFRG